MSNTDILAVDRGLSYTGSRASLAQKSLSKLLVDEPIPASKTI